jgi:hypothetical protein
MNDDSSASTGCITLIFAVVLRLFLGGIALEYAGEYWAAHLGNPVDIPFWAAAIAGLFVCKIAVAAAVLTWLFSVAIGK